MSKVKIVGMGYVGQTLAAAMAEAGLTVYGIDNDEKVIAAMKSCKSHVYETGLNELLEKHINQKLFVGKWEDFKDDADAIIISVPSPFDKNTKKSNITYVQNALENCAKTLKKGQLVVLRSTVPLGTTRDVAKPILEKSGLKAGKDFYLAFAPERTIQGAAIRELTILPQIIGGIGEKSAEVAADMFRQVTPTIVLVSSPEAAEVVKLVDNSFRDVKFGYANELAALCENAGLNAFEIIRAANRGYFRNNIPLPSPGVGGGCLTKDPHIFAESAKQRGAELKIIKDARQTNEDAPKRIADRLRKLGLKNKTILIAGLAFKGEPETNDMRESPTLDVIKHLGNEHEKILGYDPLVEAQKMLDIGIEPVKNLESAIESADVVVFMTNHKQFLDPKLLNHFAKMKHGSVVVDGWGLFDKKAVEKLGLKYVGVGISDNY